MLNEEKDKNSKRGFKRYVDNKAFYGVLALGILVVCITGMLAGRQGAELAKKEMNTNKAPSVFGNLDNIRDLSQIAPTATPTKKILTSNTDTAKPLKSTNETQAFAKVEARQVPIPPSADFKLIYPASSILLNGFAEDSLIYSKTLGDFRTHSGIDIAGDATSAVKAAADGKVEKVYKDDKLGITIIIDHGNGIKTKYGDLSTDAMVKAGDIVKTGDVISGIGETAPFEVADAAHLHFEVIKDDKAVSPDLYLIK